MIYYGKFIDENGNTLSVQASHETPLNYTDFFVPCSKEEFQTNIIKVDGKGAVDLNGEILVPPGETILPHNANISVKFLNKNSSSEEEEDIEEEENIKEDKTEIIEKEDEDV